MFNSEKILNNTMIFKSNSLIEIGFPSKFKFSVNEYKIVNYFISKIRFGEKSFRTFEVNVTDLNKEFDIKSGATYNQLKTNYMSKLLSKNFFIKNSDSTKAFNWFSFIESKKGIFRVCFNEELKDFLIDDFWKSGYTKYNLWCIVNLKSFFSIRIYELLKQHQKFKSRNFYIKDLKYFLGVSDKYDIYSNLKKRVLNLAIKEINEKTDIKVLLVENRSSRNVESITFHITKNMKNIKQRNSNITEDTIVNLLYFLKDKYDFDMDYNKLKDLINTKGYDLVKKYADNFQVFIDNHNMKYRHKFFYSAVIEEWTATVNNTNIVANGKPEQATNFEQRKYDDEFFESLYDNL